MTLVNDESSSAAAVDADGFSHESTGINLIPFAIMAGGWLGPLIMFWLYVWGPLRPFDYPAGDVSPSVLAFGASFAACMAISRLPPAYYRIKRFERSGRLYLLLGVRLFRNLVPDGDIANRWRRRQRPQLRLIACRNQAIAFVKRTESSERGHLVLLAMGILTAAYAASISWSGWALYITIGNVLVNLYPALLQRYTRTRIDKIRDRLERKY
jgi:hypothetical protein